MANLFKNNPQQTTMSPRQSLMMKYNSARGNLLAVILFTLVNIVLLVTKSGFYFLFSAFIPYMLVDEAWFYTGRYPAELYEEYYPGMIFSEDKLLYICLAIAIVIVAVYFIFWLFSKNNRAGWLVATLVFFSLDTVSLLLYSFLYVTFDPRSIIDILFHAWVLYYLINGLVANSKLKKLPAEADVPEEGIEVPVTVEETGINE